LNELNDNKNPTRSMANSDLLTFLNIIIKAGLKCKDFKQIGRLPKFFFPKDARAVEDEPL